MMMKTALRQNFGAVNTNCGRQVLKLRILRLFQTPFGKVFWRIEQAVSRIEDGLANR
jgi:hypothetical protein